jgi:hypothetical protein
MEKKANLERKNTKKKKKGVEWKMKTLDQKIKLALKKTSKNTFFPLFYSIPIVSFIPFEPQNFSIL